MDTLSLSLILGATLVIGVCGYLLIELKARTLRTRVIEVPGTLRFESHTFSINVELATKQIRVHMDKGRLTRHALQGGPDEVQEGPLDATLPAPGLHIVVKREEMQEGPGSTPTQTKTSGPFTITLRASDATINAAQKLPGKVETVLEITSIPATVAKNFENFSNRVQIWADKLEHRLKMEGVERTRKEEKAAQAQQEAQRLDASAAENDAQASQELANEQIARWRKAAGFKGAYSEVSIGANGRVHWFIDLAPDGRLTLHANQRTIHTTLLGASFVAHKLTLEIQVRDDYWTEEDPLLSSFELFDGLPPDARRVWKERLESIRNKLDREAHLDESKPQ